MGKSGKVKKGSSRGVEFEPEYIGKSHVQQKQNRKFLRFIFSVLKRLGISLGEIKSFCEVGVADIEFTKRIEKSLKLEKVILIDRNEYFAKLAVRNLGMISSDSVEGKYVVIAKDFLDVKVGDRGVLGNSLVEGLGFIRSESIDLFVSSNTFHWFGKRWEIAVKKVYDMLSPFGFVFIHQGLKWSYFPLYDLAGALLRHRYGIVIDLDDYLYYPYPAEIRRRFRDLGFSVVDFLSFYEFENFNSEYEIEELVESFSVAGLLPFLSSLGEEEKEIYRKSFIRAVLDLRPPVFAHRGFFALRKRIKRENIGYDFLWNNQCSCLSDGSKYFTDSVDRRNYLEGKVIEVLEEVADDFEPSLRVRLPSTSDFSGVRSKLGVLDRGGRGSVLPYANEIFSKGCVIVYFLKGVLGGGGLAGRDREVLGILAFQVGSGLEFFGGGRYIYVSTVAVRRRYRGLGVGKMMYQIFLELLRERYRDLGIERVVTRTWSTNERMKVILRDLGFQLEKVVENDRGPGIHTEYYVLQFR